MNVRDAEPTLLLVGGYWLGAWAWDAVGEHLTSRGRRSVALTLPGLDAADPARATRTLEDQALAIERAIAAEREPVAIVAHSGANAPVSMVLDRNPDRVSRVVWVDSGPLSPGYAPGAPDDLEELPLPPFDVLADGASLEGLDAATLEQFRRRAVPEPGPVVRGSVTLSNPARRRVPTTLVCCSISGSTLMSLARDGHPMFAEVASIENLEVIDLPTGHWPMWSRAEDLAQVMADAVGPR